MARGVTPPSPPWRAALAIAALAGCAAGPEPVQTETLAGEAMGTSYRVTVAGLAGGNLGAIVRDTVDRVDSLMSTYRDDSEVSRLNRHPALSPMPVSAETFEVLAAARRASDLTGGAFDVTVGSLVSAWGFGPASAAPAPAPAVIRQLRDAGGWDKLELDAERHAVRKLHPETTVDLSGIAKGFAVDLVAGALEREGHRSYLVDIGGEVRVGAARAPGNPWRVGVERPQSAGRRPHRILPLARTAVATSGNYRNFRERDGRRFGHVLDPRTGMPSESDVASASVLDPSAMRADALATAMLVLGAESAIKLAEREGLAVLLLVPDGDGGWNDVESTQFRARMGQVVP